MRPAILAFGAAAAAWSLPAPAPHAPRLAATLRVPLRLEGADGVALTFDDGPHPHGTPAVLDALARAGATATFFVVGERVAREPALAREIVAAGHALALHGQRHRCQLLLTPIALDGDLLAVADTVQDATASAPTLYRPPFGIFSAAGLALVRRRGWRTLLWSRWGARLGRPGHADGHRGPATRALTAGDVVLLHDDDTYSSRNSWRRTAAALPAILEAVHAAGLRTVTA
jgi:peptidoglycan-N-acetylglucosamine deacetylase